MISIQKARSWYAQDDPVHGFDHILRVYRTAEQLAREEGADLEVVRAAALLHDAGGEGGDSDQQSAVSDQRSRVDHQRASAEFAAQVLRAEGWGEERIAAVQHCIRAHRFRDDSEQPETREAQVLFDADKLDAIGATGVARAVAFAALRGQPAWAEPSVRFLETGQLESGEPHSAYHEYVFKLRKLEGRLYTASARRMAQARRQFMEAYFERLAREGRGEE